MIDDFTEKFHILGHKGLASAFEPEGCPFCEMLAAAPDKAKNLRDYRDAFGPDDPRALAAFGWGDLYDVWAELIKERFESGALSDAASTKENA